MKDQKKACELAEEALQGALDKIDDISEEDFRDAKSIIELLKENLTLWKEEEGGQGNNDQWEWSLELWKNPQFLITLLIFICFPLGLGIYDWLFHSKDCLLQNLEWALVGVWRFWDSQSVSLKQISLCLNNPKICLLYTSDAADE